MNSNDFFTFVTGQATDVGCRRDVNEDSFLTRPDYGMWIVADGMGGHAAGDFASRTIVEELNSVGIPASAEDQQARFMERLSRANSTILHHAQQLALGSIGSTLVALLVHEGDFACIWCGDSRIYLLRDGQFVQQSRDHTEVQALLDAQVISPEEAANWPRKNVITRAVGVTPVPECDIVGGPLRLGDTFVLCSDGLTEHLEDAEIGDFVRRLPPQEACDAMIALTLERGAKDNVTVIAMRCMPPPPPEPADMMDDMAEDDDDGMELDR